MIKIVVHITLTNEPRTVQQRTSCTNYSLETSSDKQSGPTFLFVCARRGRRDKQPYRWRAYTPVRQLHVDAVNAAATAFITSHKWWTLINTTAKVIIIRMVISSARTTTTATVTTKAPKAALWNRMNHTITMNRTGKNIYFSLDSYCLFGRRCRNSVGDRIGEWLTTCVSKL